MARQVPIVVAAALAAVATLLHFAGRLAGHMWFVSNAPLVSGLAGVVVAAVVYAGARRAGGVRVTLRDAVLIGSLASAVALLPEWIEAEQRAVELGGASPLLRHGGRAVLRAAAAGYVALVTLSFHAFFARRR